MLISRFVVVLEEMHINRFVREYTSLKKNLWSNEHISMWISEKYLRFSQIIYTKRSDKNQLARYGRTPVDILS